MMQKTAVDNAAAMDTRDYKMEYEKQCRLSKKRDENYKNMIKKLSENVAKLKEKMNVLQKKLRVERVKSRLHTSF